MQRGPATAGEQAALGYAAGPEMAGQIGGAQQAWQSALGAADVSQNPYLQSAIGAATAPMIQQFTEGVLPELKGGALSAGGYGGTRQDIATGRAAEGLTRSLGDVASKMGSQAYGQGLQAQTAALGMAPQMTQLGMMPSQIQRGIEAEQLQRGMQEQMLPWQQLQQAAGIIGGPTIVGGGGGGGWSVGMPKPPVPGA
jgi:hypothetical protein